MSRVKYIRDSLYEDFIVVEGNALKVMESPYFQRLRRIAHLGLASYVYPGATHTRFSHSLGVMHLMKEALRSLEHKGIEMDEGLKEGAVIAALVHDIGHGPFSHALEHTLIGVRHEEITRLIVREKLQPIIGEELSSLVISIFDRQSPRWFVEELMQGQIDVDRMDYLRRDALMCGVNYGMIDVVRILHTLNVTSDGHLAVEEKGKHAVEGYLVGRYLMYWSVYFHKTNLSIQALLSSLFRRVRDLLSDGADLPMDRNLQRVISAGVEMDADALDAFLNLDDSDIFHLFKLWRDWKDPVLSDLSDRVLSRRLFKAYSTDEMSLSDIDNLRSKLEKRGYDPRYYLVEKIAEDTAYEPYNPHDGQIIRILMKDGSWKEISQVLPTDVLKALSRPVEKRFIFAPEDVE